MACPKLVYTRWPGPLCRPCLVGAMLALRTVPDLSVWCRGWVSSHRDRRAWRRWWVQLQSDCSRQLLGMTAMSCEGYFHQSYNDDTTSAQDVITLNCLLRT